MHTNAQTLYFADIPDSLPTKYPVLNFFLWSTNVLAVTFILLENPLSGKIFGHLSLFSFFGQLFLILSRPSVTTETFNLKP